MNKLVRVSRSFGCMPLSQDNFFRFGRGFGFFELVLLLIFMLTLVSCDSNGDLPGEEDLSSTVSTVTAPANIAVAATNAGGTAATDPAITAFLNGASAFDTEDGVIATITNDGPGIFPLGATTVTFSATDSDSNTFTAQATVTVTDQTVPVITLLGLASVTLNVGDPYTDAGATANDNVDGNLTPSIVTGGSVNTAVAGLYTLTYDVSDAAGNPAAQVTRSISVQDAAAPVVMPLASITVAAVDATGTAATDASIAAFLNGATALDAVDGPIVPVINDAPAQFPLGVTTVTFSAVDGSGNTGQAAATVTVDDQAPPVVIPPADITVAATSPAGIAATDLAIVAFLAGASAFDNVDGPIATISNSAPATFPVGTTPVTFIATDVAGNSGNAQASVTVNPFVSVQKIAFSRDVGGQLDLFAINEDGTGLTMLASAAGDEVFAGVSANLVIYVREIGGQNDIFTVNKDGSGGGTLSTDVNDELPVAVTADGRVIFMRILTAPSLQSDLYSVKADGSGSVLPLATNVDNDFFGGLTSNGRVVYDSGDALFTSDVYSIVADGSASAIPLAVTADLEAGAGISTGNRVVFARTVGGLQNDILTISADGVGGESPLVNTGEDELPIGVTASDLVIFTRTTSIPLPVMSLLSVGVNGTPGEVLLATSDILATGDIFLYGGFTGGRVIYHRCDLLQTECNVYSRNVDGSGTEATLAGDPLLNEVFAGVSSDGLVIIVRDNAGTTELISVNADGTGATTLATAPTPVPPAEVFKGVTANGRVIFERDMGGHTDLFSILADGTAIEVPLAPGATNESFGGVF